MKMAHSSGASGSGLSDAETKLQISVRDDLAANLGGDFLFALDGAVLPTPAWKAVVEVRNAARLESTLERLAATGNQMSGSHAHNIVIQSSQSDDRTFYSINDTTSGATVMQYTFADGYMIMAPDRALLMQALHAHASGNSLARSAALQGVVAQRRERKLLRHRVSECRPGVDAIALSTERREGTGVDPTRGRRQTYRDLRVGQG